jgi:hypothetical protein
LVRARGQFVAIQPASCEMLRFRPLAPEIVIDKARRFTNNVGSIAVKFFGSGAMLEKEFERDLKSRPLVGWQLPKQRPEGLHMRGRPFDLRQGA